MSSLAMLNGVLTHKSLSRFRKLDAGRVQLLIRAATLLTASSMMVALLPFRSAIRFGSVPLGRARWTVDDCLWAIEVVARRIPLRTVCIEKGLSAQRLLRHAGNDAILHYGARQSRDTGALEAHVWVTIGGTTVIGEVDHDEFARLATYPRAAE